MGTRWPQAASVTALTAVALLSAASALAHDGIPERIATLSAQIASHPPSAEILVRRAELYRLAREWRLAAADLERATDVDPTLASIDLARAHLLADTGRFQAAADAASRVLTHESNHVDALLVRARARARLNRGRDALADYNRVLQHRPLPDLYIERARADASGPGADLVAVVNGLDDGLRRLGPLVTLELEAIAIERRLKRYDSALARLERLSTQAARKDTWLARRGEILEQAGRRDEARVAYESALTAATTATAALRPSAATAALVERLRASLVRLDSHPTSHTRHEGTP